jgi:hypothetical protein
MDAGDNPAMLRALSGWRELKSYDFAYDNHEWLSKHFIDLPNLN